MSARASRRAAPVHLASCAALLLALVAAPSWGAAARVRDLARREGDVPRRLVGYGLVVGLSGTGDRSLGIGREGSPTVRSVLNLLRRFRIEVPEEQVRLRNVAAVLVTAEVSPYLRSGGRFDVSVAALGDAISLQNGQLWMTPLVTGPDDPPLATAQGSVELPELTLRASTYQSRGNAGRVPQGGVIETDGPRPAATPRLFLREPDLVAARRLADVVNAAYGAGTARVEDEGAVALQPDSTHALDLASFLAAVDTLEVSAPTVSRIVIDAHAGTVVAGGDVRIGPAVVSHHGLTLAIGNAGAADSTAAGVVRLPAEGRALDVAAGLRAAGATASEIGAVFSALRASGALQAEVVIR